MKLWIMYISFIVVISITLFIIYKYFFNNKNKKNLNENIKKEVSYDLSREDKTEIINLNNKGKSAFQDKEVKEIFIDNINNDNKSEISVTLEDDMDITIIDRIEENTSDVYGKLEFIDANEFKEYKITKNEVIVGRDPRKSDLCISGDSYLGRVHGKFLIEDSKIYFIDLESKNGSFFNGNKLSSKIEILDGMIIKLARTEMRFRK